MNNMYLTSLFCITILAFTPACKQKKEHQKNSKTIIASNNAIETEEDSEEQKPVKF